MSKPRSNDVYQPYERRHFQEGGCLEGCLGVMGALTGLLAVSLLLSLVTSGHVGGWGNVAPANRLVLLVIFGLLSGPCWLAVLWLERD